MGRRSVEPFLGFTEAKPPGGYLVTSLSQLSPQVLADLVAYLNPQLNIPINQVLGFTQYAPQQANVATAESLTNSSTTYTDLPSGTVGPSLSALADGQYLVLLSAAMGWNSGATGQAYMSVSPNGTTAVDADAARFNVAGANSGTATAMSVQTLKAGTNTLVAKYRTDTATSVPNFRDRRIVALRISNP